MVKKVTRYETCGQHFQTEKEAYRFENTARGVSQLSKIMDQDDFDDRTIERVVAHVREKKELWLDILQHMVHDGPWEDLG